MGTDYDAEEAKERLSNLARKTVAYLHTDHDDSDYTPYHNKIGFILGEVPSSIHIGGRNNRHAHQKKITAKRHKRNKNKKTHRR